MMDIENAVLDGLKKRLLSQFSDLKGSAIRSEHMNSPPVFPCVMAYESSSSTLDATADEHGEHHANLRYTTEVYTNNKDGKKQKAKEIANAFPWLFSRFQTIHNRSERSNDIRCYMQLPMRRR